MRIDKPIQGIKQPNLLQIDTALRLRRFDGVYDFALKGIRMKICSGWWTASGTKTAPAWPQS